MGGDGQGGWAEVHGRVEEIRGRCGMTSLEEEGSNETGKLVIAHGSVEFCEAAPFDLVDESKESLYGREADRDLRSACRCVTWFYLFSPNEQRGGWGGGTLPDFYVFLFSLISRPRAGLATV